MDEVCNEHSPMKIPVNIIRNCLNQWQPETGVSLLTQIGPATITAGERPLRRSYLLLDVQATGTDFETDQGVTRGSVAQRLTATE